MRDHMTYIIIFGYYKYETKHRFDTKIDAQSKAAQLKDHYPELEISIKQIK